MINKHQFVFTLLTLFAATLCAQETIPVNIVPKMHIGTITQGKEVSNSDYSDISLRIKAGFEYCDRVVDIIKDEEVEVYTTDDYRYMVTAHIAESYQTVEDKEKKEKKYKKVKGSDGKDKYEPYEVTIPLKHHKHILKGKITIKSMVDNTSVREIDLYDVGEYTNEFRDNAWKVSESDAKSFAKNDAFNSIRYTIRYYLIRMFPVEANVLHYDYTAKGKKILKVGIDVGKSLIKKGADFQIMVPVVRFGEVTYEYIGCMTAETIINQITECDVTKGQTTYKTRSRLFKEMKEYEKRLKKDPDNPYPIKARFVSYCGTEGAGDWFESGKSLLNSIIK